ncbi:Eco57I restriction-modification methylase domain-containing protein [Nitrincola nitratireducens]|uniref:site-specific DNA-methyltransferase (adenine-specific) n=1 Tax=Nitrincola nitratireducens TaxID=1229521 RepID=W9UPP8_9GAMM|nr:DNA methyltransferase [Nitrincola nitratireducens]EXJ09183.1 type II restriction m6 adenine DNA methyltransferase, Alw26I/Eco31I/Esp3I family [Nitrincola nitratireducens]
MFELKLAPNHQLDLEKLLISLPTEVFTATDSLGWVYQFWQANNKERINKSEVKIGARELPAVTQLFTEPYMVSFLLDNSLGAWWAARRLSEDDFKNAGSEEELRRKAAIDGVPLEYLRFVQGENGTWEPASGIFDAWPKQLSQLSTLDPSCGSGHFLVAAFNMLVPLRMELEQLDAQQAADAVLRDNIHGLELDQRCVELAAFALALSAWKYPNAGGYRVLPEIQVACSGLAINAAKDEWKQLAAHMGGKHNLSIAMDWLHDNFKDAPVLGSLMNPAKSKAAGLVSWQELSEALDKALATESAQESQTNEQHEAAHENAVVAQGMAKAAKLLASQYQWVVTNVPYLVKGKQVQRLQDYCSQMYPLSKNDLATVFLERCLEFCAVNGTVGAVLPQTWLFQKYYESFRKKLLINDRWHLVARLGEGGFESSAAAGAFATMVTLSRGGEQQLARSSGLFKSLEEKQAVRGLDVSQPKTAPEKAILIKDGEIRTVLQNQLLENPDSRISIEDIKKTELLLDFAMSVEGLSTGDGERFVNSFWEIEIEKNELWDVFQRSPESKSHYSGLSSVLRWERNDGELSKSKQARLQGYAAWGKSGVLINLMRSLHAAIYFGNKHDKITAALVLKDKESKDFSRVQLESMIWAYCSSPDFNIEVRKLNPALQPGTGTLVKVPFDIGYWAKVAEDKYPNGLPKPYTDDPTQWIFHGHPCGSVIWDEAEKWTTDGPLRTDETVLHIAVARLLGYRWPAELDATMEQADEQREWVQRCEALLPLADEDGIVCIPAVRGEALAADRLINLLAAAYGDAWTPATLNQLLSSVAMPVKP